MLGMPLSQSLALAVDFTKNTLPSAPCGACFASLGCVSPFSARPSNWLSRLSSATASVSPLPYFWGCLISWILYIKQKQSKEYLSIPVYLFGWYLRIWHLVPSKPSVFSQYGYWRRLLFKRTRIILNAKGLLVPLQRDLFLRIPKCMDVPQSPLLPFRW